MEYNIKLSQQDIQVILTALGELPLKTTLATFGKISQSVAAQDEANAVPISSIEAGC